MEHPDLGGDPAEFIRAMESFGADGGRPAAPVPARDEVRFVRTPRGMERLTAWWEERRRRRHRPPRVR